MLVVEGVQEADKFPLPNPAAVKAIQDIDRIAARKPLPAAAAASAEVQAILATIIRPLAAPGLGSRSVTTQDLIVMLDTLDYATLAAWTVISFITGYLVLILNKPGFGTPTDYLYCLIWGFGISTASALTSNPAASALGIKIPEAH